MFKRSTPKATQLLTAGATHMGEGTLWQGEIRTGANDLHIEGSVEGTILSEGRVTVGPTGLVKGAIHARRLSVLGRVEGSVRIEGCLEILGSGWVEGDVELDSLVVDQGGVLQGTCARRTLPTVKEPVPLVPRREEPLADRSPHPSSGTHGGSQDASRSGRGATWMKP